MKWNSKKWAAIAGISGIAGLALCGISVLAADNLSRVASWPEIKIGDALILTSFGDWENMNLDSSDIVEQVTEASDIAEGAKVEESAELNIGEAVLEGSGSSHHSDDGHHSLRVSDQVEALDITSDMAGIQIERGESFEVETSGVSWSGSHNSHFSCVNKDGTLVIASTDSRKGIQNWGTITIRVPYELKKITVNTSMGQIRISDIKAKTVEAVNDMGNVVLQNIECSSLSVTDEMGSIEATDCRTNICDLTNNMGAITFTGKVQKRMTGSASAGSIEATLHQPLSKAKLDLKADMGEVEVNGQKKSDSYSKDGGNPLIDLSVDMGSIHLNMD